MGAAELPRAGGEAGGGGGGGEGEGVKGVARVADPLEQTSLGLPSDGISERRFSL